MTMDALLNFSSFDVALLDAVVKQFYESYGAQQKEAAQILDKLQSHPDSWTLVDQILSKSQYMQSKYFGLQILETVIKTIWKALPAEQRRGIKDFIVALIIETSSTDESLEKNQIYLSKLNIVLVQILKQEWPHNWPSFIPEIVSSSKANLSLCENNMRILKLLSEEIFDFSAEQLTSQKAKNLKNQMCGEFSEIFQLCHEILEKASKPSLVKATLETTLRFLNWIPLGYIFETNIIDNLITRFLQVPMFRNTTLKCLTEIAGLSVGPEYNAKFIVLFERVMEAVTSMIPLQADLNALYENSHDHDQRFIQDLAMFLTALFREHLVMLEEKGRKDLIIHAHNYLLSISRVDEREMFKVCLEYWAKLVAELYEQLAMLPAHEAGPLKLNPLTSNPQLYMSHLPLRKHMYTGVLSDLRVVMIERMVKPEEVLIVENDEGEIVREFVKESDTITLYKSMREVLVYLTHLDTDDTENIMTAKLSRQMDGSEWSWENINKLCWAIGSISGAMTEDAEKRFLVTVIKDLLSLTEMKRGKDNKAVVASNIMYIVGQYPRFLKAHWKFLKTVVNKLFEFMHETHEGVQDMACDTFIKIAQKCKRHFIMQQLGEVMPFIEEILATIREVTSDLAPQQVHTFYEACGYMISAQTNKQVQDRLIEMLMAAPNVAWGNMMAQANQNINVLESPENVKILGNVLKTNVSACTAIGAPFIHQIAKIYMEMLILYKATSQLISAAVATQGEIATKTPRVRGLRTIKKEILKLIECYVTKAEDLQSVTVNLIPPLLDAVLGDYNQNVEPARDAEVLSVMATIIGKLGELMTPHVTGILEAVFECTLNMINKNFEDYPEHRVGFYKMIHAIVQQCFPAIIQLSGPQFKLFLDSVVWAFKHQMRDINDLGLSICLDLLTQFSKADPRVSNAFYQGFFLSVLQDIFYVLTNSFHKSGFKLQTMILMQMFASVESGAVGAPLFDVSVVANANLTNVEYLKGFVADLLLGAFQNLQPAQVRAFVEGLFVYARSHEEFKNHVRDFLIQLKEFAGDELYLSEKEVELEAKKKADFEAALRVPGLVKPHDRPDEGMMD